MLQGPSGVCWFDVNRPHRDGESCFDITRFHHIYVGFHTKAYIPSYWDHLEFVSSVKTTLVEMVSHALILQGFIMLMLDAILGHTTLVIEIVWSRLDGMDSCYRENKLVVTLRADATL